MKVLFKVIFALILMSVIVSLAMSLIQEILPLAIVAGIVYLVYRYRNEIKNFLGIGKSEVIKEKQF